MGFSLLTASRGCSLVAVSRLLIAVASLVAEHGLQGAWALVAVARGLSSCGSQALEHRLSSCGTQAQLLRVMWDRPRLGMEPMSPALEDIFFTGEPPGKPCLLTFKRKKNSSLVATQVSDEQIFYVAPQGQFRYQHILNSLSGEDIVLWGSDFMVGPSI